MNDYQTRVAAESARLRDMLEGVAAELDGWTTEYPHDHNGRLVGPDGVHIYARLITYGAGNGRVQLTGGSPDGANYSAGDYGRDTRPEITVSADRPAATLARDISRRLIPQAVEYWTAVAERMAARLSALDAAQTLAGELAGIMGTTAREWRDNWTAGIPDRLSNLGPGRNTYGEMAAEYGGQTVKLELRGLSADRARQLAHIIAGWK